MSSDDFKNFLVIQKFEDEKKEETVFSNLLKKKWYILGTIIFIVLCFIIYNVLFYKVNLKDSDLKDNLLQINNGESINYIGQKLEDKGIIKSSLIFKIYIKIFSTKEIAQAGIYKIEESDTLTSLANKIMKAHYAIPPIRITIPEGSDNTEIAEIINKGFDTEINRPQLLDDFSNQNILSKLKNKEGYLFPDTYLFLPNITLEDVVNQIENNFYYTLKDLFIKENKILGIYSIDIKDFKVDSYFNDEGNIINLSKRLTLLNSAGTTTVSIKDIIIMASYLEGEANNEEDMRKVAGVLWTRLKLNYPLQIDAATSTYKNRGLTNSPINNPGLVAIRSAINPIDTGSIYYLTGNDGKTYYSKTYKEHLEKINKYLRN